MALRIVIWGPPLPRIYFYTGVIFVCAAWWIFLMQMLGLVDTTVFYAGGLALVGAAVFIAKRIRAAKRSGQ